jgi:type IV pilus assembly protein PilQ
MSGIMTSVLSWLTVSLWLLSVPIQAETTSANQLNKMGFTTLPGSRVQVNLDFAQAAVKPLSFSTDNPARIALDFPGTSLNIEKKSQVVGIGALQGLSAVETPDRARVVLNLVNMVPFNVEVKNTRVIIELEGMPATQSASNSATSNALNNVKSLPTTPPPTVSAPQPTTPKPTAPIKSTRNMAMTNVAEPVPMMVAPLPAVANSGYSIQNIEFHRTEGGVGKLTVTLSDPSVVVDMKQEGKDIILDFLNSTLPEKLDRRLEVTDFGTPISLIDTTRQGDGTIRMKITVADDAEHLAYQSENKYVLEVKQLKPEEKKEAQKKDPTYTGQKVSFNFQKISIRAALLLLTDLPGANLNLVASDNVKGEITLKLKNVPWDQALDIILEANGLGMKKIGNVVMVDSKVELSKREEAELKAMQTVEQLAPLRTEYIQINYHKAKDISDLLVSKSGEKGFSFLSARGNVSFDEKTNTLILRDTAEQLVQIRQLVTSLDVPIRQVLIESKVVIADDNFGKSLGVKFGYSTQQTISNSLGGVVFGGQVPGTTQFGGGTGFVTGQAADAKENWLVSLPETLGSAQNAALGLAIGKIGSYLLQLELSALQQESRGEILSSPRVVTANQQKATILQGQQVPYIGAAAVGTPALVQFVDALLKLEVTPQITPDDRIIMDLLVTKDDVIPVAAGQPPISKRAVQTQVLVDNGETVVLGGVYERTLNNSVERVPFFGDLPLVGNLFKRNRKVDNKSELLIFVTPKIIKDSK